MKAQQKKLTAKNTKIHKNIFLKNAHSRIIGSAPTNSDLVARKRRLLNTRVTLLHVYLAIPPQCVLLCVAVCTCVYLCVPVLLCNCVRCICKLLLAHIAASIQFRNGREKKTLALSKHHCSSWKVNVPCKGAIILNLKLFFNP